jgi:hypothetical protein
LPQEFAQTFDRLRFAGHAGCMPDRHAAGIGRCAYGGGKVGRMLGARLMAAGPVSRQISCVPRNRANVRRPCGPNRTTS